MSQKSFYSVVGALFLIITVIHFLRILNGWEVNIDAFSMPMWASWVSVLLAGYLAYHGLKRRG